MKKLKYAIVGWGSISDIHAQALIEAENSVLTAVYTSSIEKKEQITEKYDVQVFNDYKELLKTDIDVVSICTPSGTHLEFGKLAAEAGKHVVVEKPIEVSIEKGKKLIEICKDNRVKLGLIFQNRYLKSVIKIKSIIDEGLLGKIFHVSAYIKWFRTQDYYNSGNWRGTFNLDGGGATMNQAIHTVDLLLHLIGDVEKVAALTGTFTHVGIEVEDSSVAVLKFKNGAIGTIEASTAIQPAQPRCIEIHGEKGTIILEGDEEKIKIEGYENNNTPQKSDSSTNSPFAGFKIYPHKNQFEAISNSIINNYEIAVNGEESLKSLALVKSIYESDRIGQFVKIL